MLSLLSPANRFELALVTHRHKMCNGDRPYASVAMHQSELRAKIASTILDGAYFMAAMCSGLHWLRFEAASGSLENGLEAKVTSAGFISRRLRMISIGAESKMARRRASRRSSRGGSMSMLSCNLLRTIGHNRKRTWSWRSPTSGAGCCPSASIAGSSSSIVEDKVDDEPNFKRHRSTKIKPDYKEENEAESECALSFDSLKLNEDLLLAVWHSGAKKIDGARGLASFLLARENF